MKKEAAIIVGVVQALIVLAVAFGLDLTTEQQAAILAALAAIAALVTRGEVYSEATVKDITQDTLKRSASPDLIAEATRLAKYLPGPVGTILATVGPVGLQLAVDTAKKMLERAPSQNETDSHVMDNL